MQNSSIQFPFILMYTKFQLEYKDQDPPTYIKTPLAYKYICGECKKNNYYKICNYCNNTDHFHKKNIISKFYRKIIKCKKCKKNNEKDKLDLFPPLEYKAIYTL